MMCNNLKYYVFEGIDSVGKTTHFNLIKQHCLDSNLRESFKFIQEPNNDNFGSTIRKLILNNSISRKTEFLLFLAQRAEIFSKLKEKNNFTLISDRSLISGIAYSLDLLEFDLSIKLNLFATDNIFPQKIIFLKISRDELKIRMENKNLDSIESRGIDFLLQIQDKYFSVLKYFENLGSKVLCLDSSHPKNELFLKIKSFLKLNI